MGRYSQAELLCEDQRSSVVIEGSRFSTPQEGVQFLKDKFGRKALMMAHAYARRFPRTLIWGDIIKELEAERGAIRVTHEPPPPPEEPPPVRYAHPRLPHEPRWSPSGEFTEPEDTHEYGKFLPIDFDRMKPTGVVKSAAKYIREASEKNYYEVMRDFTKWGITTNFDSATDSGRMTTDAMREVHASVSHFRDLVGSEYSGQFLKKITCRHLTSRKYGFARSGRGRGEIFLNAKYFGHPSVFKESINKCIEDKWHPEGCPTLKAIVDHELGHIIQDGQRDDWSPDMDAKLIHIYKRSKSHAGVSYIKNNLSEYAATAKREMTAEALCEYMNSEDPRPLCKEIVHVLLQKDYQKD